VTHSLELLGSLPIQNRRGRFNIVVRSTTRRNLHVHISAFPEELELIATVAGGVSVFNGRLFCFK
jgi:hypothetical protein